MRRYFSAPPSSGGRMSKVTEYDSVPSWGSLDVIEPNFAPIFSFKSHFNDKITLWKVRMFLSPLFGGRGT